jgi:hypothetical protein
MRNISHSANTHLNYKNRWRARDAVSSRRHGESCDDIRLACHLWLLRRCPGYAAEHAALADMAARNFARP